MANITPWSNNNQNSGSSGGDNGTANQLMDAAKKTNIVSTAAPINGFEKRTKGQNEQYKKQLKERQEQTRLFAQYVQMNLQWQQEDVKSTQVLTQWRVGTMKNLTQSALIVAKGGAQQQVIAARGQAQFQRIQESTQQAINQLQQQASANARERLGRRR